jgi:ubiquitin carboxyl-terminal hydrolase 7
MDTSVTDPGGKEASKAEMELEEDSARPEGVVRFIVKDFSRLKETVLSEPVYIRNLPW